MAEQHSHAERDAAVEALENEFAALFVRVRRMYLEHAARLSPGLSPGAYKLFGVIAASEGLRPSVLSERMVADKSQVSRMLRELETHTLIERMPDPDDGRSSLIVATASGRARLAEARTQDRDRLRSTLAQWDIADVHDLTRLLAALGAGEKP